jgi:hypothetical protein
MKSLHLSGCSTTFLVQARIQIHISEELVTGEFIQALKRDPAMELFHIQGKMRENRFFSLN